MNKAGSILSCKQPESLIIGGGLAGLISAILLNRAGFSVTLIEKKYYPVHRVCGEYISNEVLPFLQSLGIYVNELNASHISRLRVSSVTGKTFSANLDLGGFGISRHTLDHFLYQKAFAEGVHFMLGLKVNQIQFQEEQFQITLSDNTSIQTPLVIAAYGKRSNLDKNRTFFYQRSPYLGVKYHVKTDFPKDLIQLDNFEGGYCGTVKIEDDRFNICYLSRTENLKKHTTIKAMEAAVLYKNPFLKSIFNESDFLYDKPEVINEISFEQKTLVENHILYCGDAAGMISPLCGNGMAMAIHSAKVLTDTIIEYRNAHRELLEKAYTTRWKQLFEKRLQIGRLTQRLFGSKLLSQIAVSGLNSIKPLSNFMISRTHGIPF